MLELPSFYSLHKPTPKVIKMKKNGKAPFVPDEDLAHTLDSMKGLHKLRNTAVLMFSHFLGLRAKELAALKVGDVYDCKKLTLKVNIRLLGAYTKGNKYREVFLMNDRTKKYLLDYLLQEHPKLEPEQSLFMSQKGGGFTADTMQKMIASVYKKAGIYATSHSGRRSFASNLIRNNADIYSIQILMGHSSIMTTQEYFTSDPNRLKDQLLKLNNRLD